MNSLETLRKEIGNIDKEILSLLKKRLEFVSEIGKLKKKNRLSIVDEKRKQEISNLHNQWAKRLSISEEFVKKIFSLIHDYSVEIQK